jgi:DNA-binding SARP family transcriptional activator/ABC-type branched-subunit amino acid transport system substrate-binding protein
VVDVRILGPLEVVAGDRVLDVRGQKQRALLAILVVHANEVVSPDTLADELWAEEPPPSAAKTLQAHISRLRDALVGASDDSGALTLQTHGHGYRLVLGPEQLDSRRFADLLEAGRKLRAEGDAKKAAATIRRALDLWRGPALVEFADEPFAQNEIARLEELRLSAVEDRVEADLDLGRHRELIPELEGFVRREPLRERARGQLMTALYRSGRQAEALRVYQDGRRQLADDLGVEPSETLQDVERRILRQDPDLAAPRSGPTVRVGRREAAMPRWIVLAAALGVGAIVGAVAWTAINANPPTDAAGVAVLDPASGEQLATVPLGTSPSFVAVGDGRVWVVDADDRTLTQIDQATRSVRRTFSTAATPTDVAVGAGAVWIGNAAESSTTDRSGSLLPVSIDRLDPLTGDVAKRINLPVGPPGSDFDALAAGLSRRHVAATTDAVWVIGPDLAVSRIDPRSNEIVATIADLQAENIAAGEGEVWATSGGEVVEIDPVRNAVASRTELTEYGLSDIAIGAGSAWLADPGVGKVWRIETGSPGAPVQIDVVPWVASVTFGSGGLWATSEVADEVHRIDPRSNTAAMVGRVPSPRGIGAGDQAIWVAVARSPSAGAPLPEAICDPVDFAGPGEPDLLLTSSLSMEGGARVITGPLVDGIRYFLEQRGFKAGQYRVGYQACDTATEQAGQTDFFRCASNAKAFARNLKVVGVVGTWESFCADVQIPIANGAPQGPLAMLSPSNTADYLTLEDVMYPSGIRNYTRIVPPNRYQGSAQAGLVKALGAPNAFLLTAIDNVFDAGFSDEIRKTADAIGVPLIADREYDWTDVDPKALAAEVASAAPGAVIIVGVPDVETGEFIRTLRLALPPGTPVILPDVFAEADRLVELLGPAAQGVYVTVYGVPNSHLPERGRAFLEDFQRWSGGPAGPDLGAAYGAQAAEILLDAIGRSDGTRASVAREMFEIQIDDGILGPIRFDENGDLLESSTTVTRIDGDQFVVDRVCDRAGSCRS